MKSHPLYERPEEDKGRAERTSDWNKSEIIEFFDNRYDDPLEEFGADNYEEFSQKIDQLGLDNDGGESDWRHDQIPDLGEKDFDYVITCYLMRLEEGEERPSKSDDYVPAEASFKDGNGDVQVKFERG